jgi:hypothetical protein
MIAAIAQDRSLPPENVGQRIARSYGEQQGERVIAGIDRVIWIGSATGTERFTSQRPRLIHRVVALGDHNQLRSLAVFFPDDAGRRSIPASLS